MPPKGKKVAVPRGAGGKFVSSQLADEDDNNNGPVEAGSSADIPSPPSGSAFAPSPSDRSAVAGPIPVLLGKRSADETPDDAGEESPAKKKRSGKGRIVSETRAPVPEGLQMVADDDYPRRCCAKCANEYLQFPGLVCWLKAESTLGKCGDCVKKGKSCLPVSYC